MEEGSTSKRYVNGVRLRWNGVIGVRVRAASDPSRGVQAADVGAGVPVELLYWFLDSVRDQAVGFPAELGATEREISSAGCTRGATWANAEQEDVWKGGSLGLWLWLWLKII